MDRKLSEADKADIQWVEELANKNGVKMGQIALAWVGQKVVSPIVGVNSVERVKESIVSVSDVMLTPQEVAYLEEPYGCIYRWCFWPMLVCTDLCQSLYTPIVGLRLPAAPPILRQVSVGRTKGTMD